MSQERLTMRKIRKVLRLKWECGLTNRAIARSCSISHSTVGEYLQRAKEAGMNWPIPADLDEDALSRRLFHPIAYDPLSAAVLSLAEIKSMVNEMLEQNRDYLPQFRHFQV